MYLAQINPKNSRIKSQIYQLLILILIKIMDRFQNLTQQQLKIKRQIEQHGEQLNQYFRSMNFKIKTQQKVMMPSYNFNSRGEILLPNQEIRKNYNNAFYGLKWAELPFCKRNIKKKCQFWVSSSFLFAYISGLFTKIRSNGLINKLPFKYYIKAYMGWLTVTCGISFIQSLLTDKHCDINSIYYNDNISRLSLARQIRNELKV